MQTIRWSPLHFLAALGAGGMAVSFFMFLMFWVPHPNQPIPVFEDWIAVLQTGSLASQAVVLVALVGIAFFIFKHVQLLAWNFAQYKQFKADGGLESLEGSNAHTQLLAMPLAVAMTINGGFIVGAVFVPKLWTIVEYLFPMAMVGFILVGIWAMRLYLNFFGTALSENRFDSSSNNSLAQLLPSFALSMVGVGLAAPAAMSHNPTVVTLAAIASLFFILAASILAAAKFVIGLSRMLEKGITQATLPTLWVLIPILTVLAIAVVRLDHGFSHTLNLYAVEKPFIFLTVVFMTQLFFGLLGWSVMKRMGYFAKLRSGEERSPTVFALICPGVALVVMGHFFANKALVGVGLIEKFDLAYIAFSAALVLLQMITGYWLLRLTRAHTAAIAAQPASAH